MKKVLLVICSVILLSACETTSNKRPANDSNYETDFRYPELTEHYVLHEKVVFPDPAYGAMLRYIDKRMYGDLISVYVYPVPGISWSNPDETLRQEMVNVMAEMDHAVSMGVYTARSEEVLSDFSFEHQGQTYSGKKARMQLIYQNEKIFDSDVYLFLEEDKLIKFRTTFDASFTADWTGDDIVRELRPGITPPPQSEYMRQLRQEYIEQMSAQFINSLRNSAEQEN